MHLCSRHLEPDQLGIGEGKTNGLDITTVLRQFACLCRPQRSVGRRLQFEPAESNGSYFRVQSGSKLQGLRRTVALGLEEIEGNHNGASHATRREPSGCLLADL